MYVPGDNKVPNWSKYMMAVGVILLVMNGWVAQVYGQPLPPPIHATGSTTFSLTGKYYYWVDSTYEVTHEQILANRDQIPFQEGPEVVQSLPLKDGWLWMHLRIWQDSLSGADLENWRLGIDYSPLDRVDAYILLPDGSYKHLKAGEYIPVEDRAMRTISPVFPIPYSPGLTSVYLHFRPISGTTIAPITLIPRKELVQKHARQNLGFGFFYGVLALFLVFNLAWFAFTGYQSSLYYAGFIAIYLTNRLVYNGHLFLMFVSPELLSPNLVAYLTNMLYAVPATFLTIEFLRLKKYLPTWAKWMKRIALFQAVITLSVFLFVSYYTVFVTMGISYLLAGICIASAVMVLAKGQKQAWVFLVAWLAFYVGDFIFNLQAYAIIPYHPYQTTLNNYTTLFQIVMLSISLALNYAMLQQGAIVAKAKALRIAKENSRLLQLQNDKLDAKVKERTQSLHQQNRQLRRHKELVHHINQNLEQMVQDRTEKAKKAQQHLLQFAFLNAHELRGPLARILGLNYLLKAKAVADDEKEFILSQIDQAGHDMDAVVKEITRTLEASGYLTEEDATTVQEMRRKVRAIDEKSGSPELSKPEANYKP